MDEPVAAVDVGTNTVLLVIARGSAQSPIAVTEHAQITRLGQGVDATRRIDDAALERTLKCLTDYGDVVRQHQVRRAAGVCTSAARDAHNGREFLTRAEQALGFPLRIIDGHREAELTFRGGLSGLAVAGRTLVLDVGGGSTEIVIGVQTEKGAVVDSAVSLDIGSVRLTERFVRNDPVSDAELEAVRESIRAALRSVRAPPGLVTAVGVAGTLTTLAAVAEGLHSYDAGHVHGSRLSRERIEGLMLELAALPLAERKRIPGLDPKRADVIVAGACIAAEVMRFASLEELVVSDRGVRWGLVQELLSAE